MQAVDDVNRGHIKAADKLYQLKALQDATRKHEYLKLARSLDGYGSIVFPHCACDSRKEGHVIASISASSFDLHACKEDGTLEVPTHSNHFNVITLEENFIVISLQVPSDHVQLVYNNPMGR